MKTRTRVLVLSALLLLAAPPIFAQQVSVNYDHSGSIAQYHTYAWGSNKTNQMRNSTLEQVAQPVINAAMQGKGLQMGEENQNPDLILTANDGMRRQTSWRLK